MSGFLDRLAVRATATAGLGGGDLLRPRVRSRFEPDAGMLIGTEPPPDLVEETFEERRTPVEAEAPAPRRERPVAVAPEASDPEEPARVRPRGPAPAREEEAVAPASRRPETFSVAWPVLDAAEPEEPPAPAPRVMPRVTPKGESPARREEPSGRLEPRAKGPFPLGGGGLDQGEGQDGGGPSQGNLEQRESLDGGRPHLDPPPVPTRPLPEGGRPLPISSRASSRARLAPPEEEREGDRGAAEASTTLSRRADLPTVEPARSAEPLPERVDDQPSETVIRVNIGQIDVRMPQPPAPAPRPAGRPAAPQLTLADYLKARRERRR